MGQCAATCAAGYSVCGTGDTAYCAALDTSRENCGTCGTTCAAGETCFGACTALTLTSLSSSLAEIGSTLTLTGTGFDSLASGDTVWFGTVAATISSASATQLVVTVPAGISGSAPVHVETEGVASNALPFVVKWTTTTPVVVNGTQTGCTLRISNTGRKVAVADGSIYVTFMCGGNLFVAASSDGGVSFAAPVQVTGMTSIADAAIAAGPSQTVYVAANGSSGTQFSVSSDGGQTWLATPTTVQASAANWLSLATDGRGTV